MKVQPSVREPVNAARSGRWNRVASAIAREGAGPLHEGGRFSPQRVGPVPWIKTGDG